MARLDAESVQCVVTSPPYWGLRDYGVSGQIGLEKTPDEFVGKMVEVFRQIRRVLKKDGTVWLNLGDSYNAYNANRGPSYSKPNKNHHDVMPSIAKGSGLSFPGIKNKSLIGIPWRVALALQADGWIIRQDIIWHKPNPMPESVTDRCTKAHEYLFLLTKSDRYFWNAEAMKEKASGTAHRRKAIGHKWPGQWASGRGTHTAIDHNKDRKKVRKLSSAGKGVKNNPSMDAALSDVRPTRNKRSVWTIQSQPYKGAHFATFPEALIQPCILASSNRGDTILDPFAGSGTTAKVSLKYGRRAIAIEMNPDYCELIRERITGLQLEAI